MLNDRERKALRDIEHGIQTDDPDLSRSFEAADRPTTYSIQRIYELPEWAYRVVIGLALGLMFLMLLAGAPWSAFFLAVVAGWAAWLRVHRSAPRSGG